MIFLYFNSPTHLFWSTTLQGEYEHSKRSASAKNEKIGERKKQACLTLVYQYPLNALHLSIYSTENKVYIMARFTCFQLCLRFDEWFWESYYVLYFIQIWVKAMMIILDIQDFWLRTISIFYSSAFILLYSFLERLLMSGFHPHIELYIHIIEKYTNICIILHMCICMHVLYELYI